MDCRVSDVLSPQELYVHVLQCVRYDDNFATALRKLLLKKAQE